MEVIVAIAASGLLGITVVMGVQGLVQEIIRRKKAKQQPKEQKGKEKQI